MSVASAGAGGDPGRGRDGNEKKGPPPSGEGKRIIDGKEVKLYGKPGKLRCLICKSDRDHVAADCPGNFCRRCGDKNHWAHACSAAKCDWCGQVGHKLSDCPKTRYPASSKRTAVPTPQTGKEIPAKRQASATVSGQSFAQVTRGAVPRPQAFISKVGSFLKDVQTENLINPKIVSERREHIARRREAVEEQYKRAMMIIARDERQLELELANEEAFRQAISQLASIQHRIMTGACEDNVPPGSVQLIHDNSSVTGDSDSSHPVSSETTIKVEVVEPPQARESQEPMVTGGSETGPIVEGVVSEQALSVTRESVKAREARDSMSDKSTDLRESSGARKSTDSKKEEGEIESGSEVGSEVLDEDREEEAEDMEVDRQKKDWFEQTGDVD